MGSYETRHNAEVDGNAVPALLCTTGKLCLSFARNVKSISSQIWKVKKLNLKKIVTDLWHFLSPATLFNYAHVWYISNLIICQQRSWCHALPFLHFWMSEFNTELLQPVAGLALRGPVSQINHEGDRCHIVCICDYFHISLRGRLAWQNSSLQFSQSSSLTEYSQKPRGELSRPVGICRAGWPWRCPEERSFLLISDVSKTLLSGQCVSSEVLVRQWIASETPINHSLLTLDYGRHFCNCLTIGHSHPLHATTGQLWGSEKGASVWTSLSSSISVILNVNYQVQHLNAFQERLLSLYLKNIASRSSLRWPAFRSTFQWGCYN